MRMEFKKFSAQHPIGPNVHVLPVNERVFFDEGFKDRAMNFANGVLNQIVADIPGKKSVMEL